MQQDSTPETISTPGRVAYLVAREGNKWRDVFRLTPGQVTTIGRAPTNRVVVRDEICSRNHCEIFQSSGAWILRELGSRNGTKINEKRISGDWELSEGQLIRIGACELGFTHDPSQSFPRWGKGKSAPHDTDTAFDVLADDEIDSEPAIIHRAGNTRYQAKDAPDADSRDRTSRELAKLYRLALEMGSAATSRELSEVVLEGLFSATCADSGAILLFPDESPSKQEPSDMRVFACRTEGEVPYQRVSEFLSRVVLVEREAILARDVSDDSRLAYRDSKGEIHAHSVICAPIRRGETVNGLVHLYSTDSENALDPDAMEFTLAVADQLAVALENMTEKETLVVGLAIAQDENESLRRQLEIESELVGKSPEMRQLRERITRIAPTGATVLIRGESGVGKELVARAIHFNSKRRNGPLVCMNCAALNETLLESELFGHERGAFTGAVAQQAGRFEQAHNGTLFLDEVGEMSPVLQAKFLRVLEGHPFERIGGGTAIKIDVRVVAATNRDLETAVREGAFRKDLYFRLQVVDVNVPPLREHRSDIPILADHFLKRCTRKTEQSVKGFSQGALLTLMEYNWPGNVRELQNVVERTVILCNSELVSDTDIQLSELRLTATSTSEVPSSDPFREMSLEALEQKQILATLERTNWNKTRAAQILGIERSTLDRKLKRYQVARPRN